MEPTTTTFAQPTRPATLPGGVPVAGSRRRTFSFRAPTGELEMQIAEMPGRATPAAVTMLLSAALAEVGGVEATAERIERLSVADRQYLLRALLIELGQDELWVSANCAGCGTPFDARVVVSQLPMEEAVEYPETSVETSHGRLRVRVPDGADQKAIAALDYDKAIAALAARLVLGVETGSGLEPWAGGELSAADIDAIDQRMYEVFPAVNTRVQARCPDCGRMGTLDVAPLRLLRRTASSVLPDVDTLARHYHWPEAEILRLPRQRRMRYVGFVDRSRGFAG
ncbi:MAG: hypothetical protein NTW28_03605 [Candidatus Solibacter sp.]|nr:hypothetical protein [Candidatus Solibacter sp.]